MARPIDRGLTDPFANTARIRRLRSAPVPRPRGTGAASYRLTMLRPGGYPWTAVEADHRPAQLSRPTPSTARGED
jgi:hypothetical protein